MSRPLPTVLALTAAAALALTGCAPSAESDDGRLSIVASTDVYADLAARVAGDAADVESIISGTVQDPHSYEATARDRLAIERADLVIANGGGYDSFVEGILEAMDEEPAHLIAVEVLGLVDEHDDEHAHEEDEDHDDHGHEDHGHDDDHGDEDHGEEDHGHEGHDHEGHGHLEGVNEHVWYDLDGMIELVHAIAHELEELAPESAVDFEANAEQLEAAIEQLHERAEAIAAQHADARPEAVVTEPVPLALLAAAGVADATPEGFSEAIEEGLDVSPALLAEVLDEIASGHVALLAYNSQTEGAETRRVREAAEEAGVPVVDFAETLPEGEDYLSWMRGNLDAIESALAANPA